MKKLLLVLISFILAISTALTGCGQKENQQKSSSAINSTTSTSSDMSLYSKPGEYPIAKDKITLKFMVPQHPAIVDYNTNEFTKYMEEKTNVKIEWETTPPDPAASLEKLNLIMASGDYPDVFMGMQGAIREAQVALYGTGENIFIPLENIIDKEAVELQKIFQENPGSRQEITSLDGHIYSMPDINQCYHCMYSVKMWVNKLWLDNLGMTIPKTTDEFYEMLKAFKEKDPNKNGKQDEIPFAGAQKNGWNNTVERFLMNSFCYYDLDMYSSNNTGLFINNGKVDVPYNDPGMKEGINYINKLYKEGLIYEGSFTQDFNQLTQLVENPDAELVGAIPSGYGGMFAKVGEERYKQFVCIAPLKGPSGIQYSDTFPYEGVNGGGFVVTKACKYPEVAVKWADYLYTFDGTTRLVNGLPDSGWRLPKDGESGINGKPALYVLLKPWDESKPQNESFIQMGITKRDSAYRLGQFMDSNVDIYSAEGLEKLLYNVSKDLYEPYAQPDKALPHLKFTKEENDEQMTLSVELNKYIKESLTKFMVGSSSADKEWDGFVQNLDKLQVKKVIDIYQKAYDRQMKK